MIRLSSLPSWQGQAKKTQRRNLSDGKKSQDLFTAGVFRLDPSKVGASAIVYAAESYLADTYLLTELWFAGGYQLLEMRRYI